MKRNVFKCYFTLHILQWQRILLVLDVRCDAHNFQKTFITGITILELFRKVHQLFHRICTVVNIQKKCNQIRRPKLTTCHQQCADNQRNNGNQRRKCSHSRIVNSHIAVADLLRIDKTVISRIELTHLLCLISKRFDNTDPRKAVLDLTIDIRNSAAVFLECTLHAAVHYQGKQQHHHNNHKRHTCQHRIYHKQDNHRADQFDKRNDNILRPMV